ncbi:hypothetical protein H5410_052988 [Solanum commersonii]|uniref:Uncharacterized protein n=1 Tax=Solanum commersonii TaxID=4109 RepID=A0A9J5X2A9_SOLCO|nr:hypothetical protein H5410_052988 [Solanum commersonii]
MDPVGPDGQNGSFSRSNELQRRKTPFFADLHTSIKILAMEPVDIDGQNGLFSRLSEPRSSYPKFQRHFCQKFSWTSVKALVMEPVYSDGKNDSFSRSNDPRRM